MPDRKSLAVEALEARHLFAGVASAETSAALAQLSLQTVNILAVAVQPDSRIVVAGSFGPVGSRDVFLARFTAGGAIDTNFGDGGVIRADFGGDDVASALAIDSQDRIVVAGGGGEAHNIVVARYTPDGRADTTFATAGVQTISFGASATAQAVTIEANGDLLVVGDGPNQSAALARLQPDGSLDQAFGSGGKELLNAFAHANDVAVDSEGRILIAGDQFKVADTTSAVVVRLLSNGTLDTTFADGDQIGGDSTEAISVALAADDVILVASLNYALSVDQSGVVALTDNSQIATNLPALPVNAGSDVTNILLQPGGSLLVTATEYASQNGESPDPLDFLIVRYTRMSSRAYQINSTFGTQGAARITLPLGTRAHNSFATLGAAALDSQGRIVLAGQRSLDGTNDLVIARETSDGTPDAAFNGDGLRIVGSNSVSGRVFDDKDADGAFGGSDAGISGFRVFLDEAPFNGVLDPGELSTPVSATGTYHFNNVPAGAYRVQEVARTGWRQSSPASAYFPITLGGGETAKNLSFANTDTVLIKGTVFLDANKNRKLDSVEPGLAGWIVYVDRNNNGVLDAGDDSTISDAKGNYRLSDLPAGNYVIRIVPRSRYTQTAPASGAYTITLGAAGTTSHKNFGEKRHT